MNGHNLRVEIRLPNRELVITRIGSQIVQPGGRVQALIIHHDFEVIGVSVLILTMRCGTRESSASSNCCKSGRRRSSGVASARASRRRCRESPRAPSFSSQSAKFSNVPTGARVEGFRANDPVRRRSPRASCHHGTFEQGLCTGPRRLRETRNGKDDQCDDEQRASYHKLDSTGVGRAHCRRWGCPRRFRAAAGRSRAEDIVRGRSRRAIPEGRVARELGGSWRLCRGTD